MKGFERCKEQFENLIRRLLPETTGAVLLDAWTTYADELSRDDVKPEAELYDKR